MSIVISVLGFIVSIVTLYVLYYHYIVVYRRRRKHKRALLYKKLDRLICEEVYETWRATKEIGELDVDELVLLIYEALKAHKHIVYTLPASAHPEHPKLSHNTGCLEEASFFIFSESVYGTLNLNIQYTKGRISTKMINKSLSEIRFGGAGARWFFPYSWWKLHRQWQREKESSRWWQRDEESSPWF